MSKLMAVLGLSFVAFVLAGDPSVPIAGYQPGSDVLGHSKIDLDQDDMNVQPVAVGGLTTGGDFDILIAAFKDGGGSVKGSGSIRTLNGFSTGLLAKACPDGYPTCLEPMFKNQMAYFNDDGEYGSKMVLAALEGTGDYAGKENSLRKEVAVKGSAYVVAGMYAIHEMEDAIMDCTNGAQSDNQDSVHAWDEAVAFYAGSLEGEAAGGNSNGEMSYRLAEKRCANFKTCSEGGGASGTSRVNLKIMTAFEDGKTLLNEGSCEDAKKQMGIIKAQMLVPLIQGMLRYAFKADPTPNAAYKADYDGKTASGKAKEIGEGWAFTAAIIGEVNACNPAAAKLLDDNMNIAATAAVKDGHLKVVQTIQKVYKCLGIKGEDVGGLVNTADDSYYAGMAPLEDEVDGAASQSVFLAPVLSVVMYVSAKFMLE